MNKNFIYLFSLFMLSLAACKKSDKDNSLNGYQINGLHDLVLDASEVLMPVSINQEANKQEKVTLSVEGLPSGVVAVIDPASGFPSFAAMITLRASGNPAAGKTPIKVVLSNEGGQRREYTLNLTIPAFEYKLEYGFTNLFLYTNKSFGNYFPFKVTYISGRKEAVTLSLKGLPAGLTAVFGDNAQVPDFYSDINSITGSGTAAGNYPVSIEAATASGQNKSFPVTLKVGPACYETYTGSYYSSTKVVDGVPIVVHFMSSQVYSEFNQVELREDMDDHILADINCADNTVKVAEQTYKNEKIWGSGTVDAASGQIKLDLTSRAPGVADKHITFELNR